MAAPFYSRRSIQIAVTGNPNSIATTSAAGSSEHSEMAQPGEQIEGLRVKPICRAKQKRDDRQRREWFGDAAGHDGRPEDIAGAIPGIEESATLVGEQIRSDVRRVTHEEREAGPGEASRFDHKRQAHADDEGDE
jgi:hypothetical protein